MVITGLQILQNVHAFSFDELKVATNGFRSSNKIGEGGFGSVYKVNTLLNHMYSDLQHNVVRLFWLMMLCYWDLKGVLQDGRIVAIKMLSAESMQGHREFMSEIASVSNINHENLVNLHGGCIDGPCKILVYDYMENGSLAQTLLGN